MTYEVQEMIDSNSTKDADDWIKKMYEAESFDTEKRNKNKK